MKLFILTSVVNDVSSYSPGQKITLPDADALKLIRAGFALQQQQINNTQQIYNQGQQAIQGAAQAHFQSQQMLSTMSQRNQAQLDAQTPKPITSPTTTGTLH